MINTKRLFGTGVALVTPFKKDHSVDFEGLERLLVATAANGVDYYVVNGTTGESPTTTDSEKKEILQFVIKHNKSNLPIVYGLGGNNTAQVLEKIEQTDLTGVDAILSVSPSYNKPSQEGIVTHFTLIADKSPIPIILYNVPGRTASNMAASTTIKLAKHPNIIGIKESSGSIEQAMQIMNEKPDDFLLISGEDLLTVPFYAIGGSGIISVMANVFGEMFSKVKVSVQKNDFDSASKELFKLLNINPLMYEESNPVGVKYVLKKQGVCEHYVRLPLLEASDTLKSKIDHCLL